MRGYDLERLFSDNAVPHTSANRRGWVTLDCPNCGGVGRLGWHQQRQMFFCWMCKRLPFDRTLKQVSGRSLQELAGLLERYKGWVEVGEENERPKGGAAVLKFPAYTSALIGSHKRYLKERGLDYEQVIAEFGEIYGTPGYAPLLPNRLVAPLYLDGQAVSYQARNILKECPKARRYHTCPPEEEIVYHRSTVYGLDACRGMSCVVVEGLFDVWKLGPGAVHTFGVAWLPAQLLTIAKRFKRVFVMYDSKGEDDPRGLAQRAGKELAAGLAGLGVDAATIDPEDAKDPGAWKLEDARRIMHELLGGIS